MRPKKSSVECDSGPAADQLVAHEDEEDEEELLMRAIALSLEGNLDDHH